MIATLFEDWIQSGKNWHRSAVYLNAKRRVGQKKKGIHTMKDRTWLEDRYGTLAAAEIIKTKREAQAKRQEGEPNYVIRNPDLPDSEVAWLSDLYSV